MKNLTTILLSLAFVSIFVSCKKDEEPDNNDNSNNTIIATPESLAGLYSVTDGCASNYLISIEYNATTGDLELDNLYDQINDIDFTLEENKLVIPDGTSTSYNYSNASGVISVSDSTITINYTITDVTGNGAPCVATLTKLAAKPLVGFYTATDDCESNPYDVIIKYNYTNNYYELDNLKNTIDNVVFSLNTNDITITPGSGSGLNYTGSGTVSGTTITLNYAITDAIGNGGACVATLVLQ